MTSTVLFISAPCHYHGSPMIVQRKHKQACLTKTSFPRLFGRKAMIKYSSAGSSNSIPTPQEQPQKPSPFCSRCGTQTTLCIPVGDDKQRHQCMNCGTVIYENPKVVVGCVPITPDGERVLLLKRAIAPIGKWTIPAGFLEMNETSHDGAAREAWEEAYAQVDLSPISLLAVYNILPAKQVQLVYRAKLLNEDQVKPGAESLHVDLFEWDKLPDESELAFPTVMWALNAAKHHRDDLNFQPDIKTR